MATPGFLHSCVAYLGALWPASNPSSPEYKAAERLFGKEELLQLHASFQRAGGGAAGGLDRAAFLALLGLLGLSSVLADGLFAAVRGPAESTVTFESLVIAKAACCKQSDAEANAFCFGILDADRLGAVGGERLRAVAAGCAAWALGLPPHDPRALQCVDAIVQGAMKVSDGDPLTEAAFVQWAGSCPAVPKLLRSLLSGTPTPQHKAEAASVAAAVSQSVQQGSSVAGVASQLQPALPELRAAKGIDLGGCLMRREWAWLLAAGLPPKQQQEWELLFSSAAHGQSFNTFMGCAGGRGPCLVLMRDEQGHIAGGFASPTIEKAGQFGGDFQCHLFSLAPAFAVHRPSGVNTNFLWCGHNFAQLPNGLGFGGQADYYGLSVDGRCESGMSRPSATYGNPCLMHAQTFKVAALEAWLVEQPPEEEPVPNPRPGATNPRGGKAGGSVLDKHRQDANFMELSGRQMQSEGYRD